MARAGKALKCVLVRYGISQNQLATAMGIDRSNVSRWVSESRDPSAEAVAQIKQALNRLQPAAAEDFVQAYLYEGLDNDVHLSDANLSRVNDTVAHRSTGLSPVIGSQIRGGNHLGYSAQVVASARLDMGTINPRFE